MHDQIKSNLNEISKRKKYILKKLNEALERKKYKSTHKLKVTEKFLLKTSYEEEIENNNYGEEIERMKSNICAILAKRVKER